MQSFITSIKSELNEILEYWQKNTIDPINGGFIGQINHYGNKIPDAPKAIILNSRILWTFSAASNHFKDKRYQTLCEKSFTYLSTYFKDTKNGGVYWEVDYLGNPTNTRKQVYAQAFTIYALAEYYKLCKEQEVLDWAISLFGMIEKHALDLDFEGYTEAFAEDWGVIEDVRLSKKEPNTPKTMNTHLHILEAYTTLYEVEKDANVHHALENLIRLFLDKFAANNNHFNLFFSTTWQNLSHEASYGHDIEAVWLLIHAARTLNDADLIDKTEALAIVVADTFIKEALDTDFGVFNSIDLKTGKVDTDKHWWPQAEAIVGLLYASKITGNDKYLTIAQKIWKFTKNTIVDTKNGEWFFRVNQQGKPYINEDKIGPWKCPYHNGRACLEIINILE